VSAAAGVLPVDDASCEWTSELRKRGFVKIFPGGHWLASAGSDRVVGRCGDSSVAGR
jgi:hypothetical protein